MLVPNLRPTSLQPYSLTFSQSWFENNSSSWYFVRRPPIKRGCNRGTGPSCRNKNHENMKTLPNRLLLNKMQDFPARYSGKLWNAAWLLDNHPSPRRKHCFVLKLFAVCCLLNTVSYSSSAKLILRQLFCTAGGVQAKTGAIVECRNTIVGWVLVRKIGNCQIVSAWGVKAV